MNAIVRLRALWQRHPFLVARVILQRLPGQPVRLESFRRYRRIGAPPALGRTTAVTVRAATLGDLDGLATCCAKRDTFSKRFADDDACLVANIDGRIVGYEWFSTKSVQVEERYGYVISIPPDAVYAYDAYVAESVRGLGVWTRIVAAADSLLKQSGRQALIAHIDLGNRESVAAHVRLGFRPVQSCLYLRIFGRSFLRVRELDSGRIEKPV